MSKAWYVINSYSGYENKAKEQLLERIKLDGKEEQFGRIEIPTHEIVELKGGKEKITEKKFLMDPHPAMINYIETMVTEPFLMLQ